MKQTVTIRQVASKAAKFLGTDKRSLDGKISESFSMMPNASRGYSVRRNLDGTYKTGLEKVPQERIQKLEQILGSDLSNTSTFWSKLRIDFDFNGRVQGAWNLTDPQTFLMYHAAIANGHLAPSEEDIQNEEMYRDAIFYIHDTDGIMKTKIALTEIKDEVTALMYKFKNDKDRLTYILSDLGDRVNPEFGASALYAILSDKREMLTKREQFESFLEVLQKPAVELQANYFFEKALLHNIIKYDRESGYFKYGEVKLKVTKPESKVFLNQIENEHILVSLIEELKDKFK